MHGPSCGQLRSSGSMGGEGRGGRETLLELNRTEVLSAVIDTLPVDMASEGHTSNSFPLCLYFSLPRQPTGVGVTVAASFVVYFLLWSTADEEKLPS